MPVCIPAQGKAVIEEAVIEVCARARPMPDGSELLSVIAGLKNGLDALIGCLSTALESIKPPAYDDADKCDSCGRGGFLVGCDSCLRWYHIGCCSLQGYTEEEVSSEDLEFKCGTCSGEGQDGSQDESGSESESESESEHALGVYEPFCDKLSGLTGEESRRVLACDAALDEYERWDVEQCVLDGSMGADGLNRMRFEINRDKGELVEQAFCVLLSELMGKGKWALFANWARVAYERLCTRKGCLKLTVEHAQELYDMLDVEPRADTALVDVKIHGSCRSL